MDCLAAGIMQNPTMMDTEIVTKPRPREWKASTPYHQNIRTSFLIDRTGGNKRKAGREIAERNQDSCGEIWENKNSL